MEAASLLHMEKEMSSGREMVCLFMVLPVEFDGARSGVEDRRGDQIDGVALEGQRPLRLDPHALAADLDGAGINRD